MSNRVWNIFQLGWGSLWFLWGWGGSILSDCFGRVWLLLLHLLAACRVGIQVLGRCWYVVWGFRLKTLKINYYALVFGFILLLLLYSLYRMYKIFEGINRYILLVWDWILYCVFFFFWFCRNQYLFFFYYNNKINILN